MRGFVYNLAYNVNKKNLLRVKINSGIHNNCAFENPVMNAPGRHQISARQVSLPDEFQPACQQLQGMQHLDL
jgi:hypothetical protein